MALADWTQDTENAAEGERPALTVVAPAWARRSAGRTVTARRAARARMMARRRRAALVAGIVVTVVVLAWPGHAFGGVTHSGVPDYAANGSLLASGQVYVVQPGDTVSSIARLINPWDPTAAVAALRRELGSNTVVTGEHVLVP